MFAKKSRGTGFKPHKWDLARRCIGCGVSRHPLVENEPCARSNNKYKAIRTMVDGESFPSRLEAQVYSELKLMQKAGLISELTRKCSVRFEGLDINYKPDAKYFCLSRKQDVWVEAKGFETERYKLVKKIWKSVGPGPLEIWKAKGNRISVTEIIKPKGT